MAEEQDKSEKTEEPSQYKLDEARKKGEVASSKEFTSALVLIATMMTLSLSSLYMYEVLSGFIYWISNIDFTTVSETKILKEIFGKSITVLFKCLGPVLLASFCFSIFAIVIQVGFLYAPDALSLKFERVNPISGLKRLCSIKSVAEAVKGLLKFIMILGIAYVMLKDELQSFVGFLHIGVAESYNQAKYMMLKLGFSIVTGLSIVGIASFAWEKYSFKRKMMSTKQESKEELKQKEGNPEIKQRIRSIQREMARKRMMNAVPHADAIITNPTHVSVAIKYDPQNMTAPTVIAKGADHVALQIRKIAKKNGVPLVENVGLARTLYKTVKIGEIVPRTLYKAVAEIIAFVYKMKRKKKALSTPVQE